LEEKPMVLRHGGVSMEEIESIIGRVGTSPTEDKPTAPGMLSKHYAPRTPIVLEWSEKNLGLYKDKTIGFLLLQEPGNDLKFHPTEILSKSGNLREAAANLFAAIRRLDALNLDLIVAAPIPEVGLGRAIMDRLRRAASKRE
jgi:L-threonylcarbamoyladenylate synthase